MASRHGLSSELERSLENLRRAFVEQTLTSTSEVTDDPNVLRRYGFRVGGLPLLHDLSQTVQLTELPQTHRLYSTGAWFIGIANLRGNLVPVFDLKPLIQATGSRRGPSRMLVIGDGDGAAAILIDGTPIPLALDSTREHFDFASVPEFVRSHVYLAYAHEGEIWLQPDYESLFQALAERAGEV